MRGISLGAFCASLGKLSIFLKSGNSFTVVPINHKPGARGHGSLMVLGNSRAERNSRDLGTLGVLGELALVLSGGVAHYGFEVVDEMGLVEVAEVQGELGPTGFGAGVELFH
jgi:hypothetical protein